MKSANNDFIAIGGLLYCSVLGVPSDASDDDIRRQYRKLAVLIHPDKVWDTFISGLNYVVEFYYMYVK